MAKRKANATEKQGGAAEPADSVQPQTTRPSSPGKVSTPGSRKRSQPVVLPQKPALSPRRAAALNEGDDAVRGAGSPVHSQAKKPAPGSTAAKRVRAADNALAEQTSGSPSRSKPGVEDVATAEPPVKAKRGRPARAPTAKSVATASAPGPVHGTSESPSRSQTAGVDKRAVATEKQPAKTRKRGRPPTRQIDELQPASHNQHVEVSPKAAGSNAGRAGRSPSIPAKRGRPSKDKAAMQQQVHHNSPAGPSKVGEKDSGSQNSPQLPKTAGSNAGSAVRSPSIPAKRGRPSKDKAAMQQQVHHNSPAGPSKVGEKDSGSQNSPQPKRKSLVDTKQLGVTGSAGRNMDVPDVTAKNSPKPTKAINRGRTSTAIDTATSESQETEEQSPSAKRAMTSASADGKKTGTAAQGAKRAGRPAKQPNTAGAADEKSRRGAKKLPTTTRTAAPKSPGKQNKKLPASSQMAASSSGAGKNKMAPKGRQQPKPKRGKRKSADDLSDVSNSSDVTPPGWERKTRRSGPFDHVGLWVKSQLAGELDSSDAGDISVASIDSIILPSGMFNRLTGAGGSSEDVDPSLSPREEILSRCEAKFGRDTLPHSTTTTGEAIGMLVHFARMRGLRFGALSELVTIINKMFAPAKDVLPAGKALGMALAQMN
nr:nucleolar and coiled-body phosphoprotein 1-like [Rhipicephalus microplus]